MRVKLARGSTKANGRVRPIAEVGSAIKLLSEYQSYERVPMPIRLLQSSDQRVASDLLRQLGYDVAPTELASRINRVLANPTHFAAVAEEERQNLWIGTCV